MAKMSLNDEYVSVRTADCVAFLRELPSDSAKLILTSPPYNIQKPYERRRATLQEYLDLQTAVIRQSLRVLQRGGSICWQVGNHLVGANEIIPLDLLLWPVFQEFVVSGDLHLRNRIVWHFEHGLHNRRRFSGRYEVILWFTKGTDYQFDLDRIRVPQKYPGKRAYKGPRKGKFSGNPLGKNPGDVWRFPNVKANHPEKTAHPCQFPIELAERLVLSLTDPGDLVVDPFCGAGSTLIAAVLHSRRAAGCDINRSYVSLTRRRIRAALAGTLNYRSFSTPAYQAPPHSAHLRVPSHFSKKRAS